MPTEWLIVVHMWRGKWRVAGKGYVCLKSPCDRNIDSWHFWSWMVGNGYFKVRAPFSFATRQGDIEAAEQMIL